MSSYVCECLECGTTATVADTCTSWACPRCGAIWNVGRTRKASGWMRCVLSVGDCVQWTELGERWGDYRTISGKIIGLHRDTTGIDPTGLDMATVRIHAGVDEVVATHRLAKA
jgi:predicted RNA-binding Zn-ribbon protein involved in translation (DUF1610 family)